MKEKGFTLIELLAVIVILAIIALIATPIVLNIIKDSKSSSVERSAELYLDQVKNEIARYNMTNPSANFNPNVCEVQNNDVKCNGTDDIIPIEISGDKPENGSKILLSNGKIIGTRNFKIGSKNLIYQNGKFKEGTDKPICTGVTRATTGNVPRGKYVAGDEYICDVGDGEDKRFFVLENNTDTVSLIMYANVGIDGKAVTSSSTNKSTVAWVTKEDYLAAGGTESDWMHSGWNAGSNDKGPITANKALKEYTSTWYYLFSSSITLPSLEQLLSVTGKKLIYVQTGYDTRMSTTWLYNYLSGTKNSVYEVYGYWTSTPTARLFQDYAWCVDSDYLSDRTIGSQSAPQHFGIRPVITLSKSELN